MNNLPNDFNANIYIAINDDLHNLSVEQAKIHYLNYGIYENRNYKIVLPHDFDVNEYLKINEDLRNFSKEQAKIHYFRYGIYEKRNYKMILPEDFDVNHYITINYDLHNLSAEQAKMHYLNYGIYENRKYNFYKDDIVWNANFKNVDSSDYLENNTYDKKSTLFYNKFLEHQKCKFKHNVEKINDYDSFILIIDFTGNGGGTTFFLDSIISKYKYHQTFLICRNYNGIIKFTINDEYTISTNFDDNNALIFLNNNNTKIKKIFINHLLGHSNEFLEGIYLLNKEVTTITHDYLWITNVPQLFYNEIIQNIENNIKSKYDLQKVDNIISQNIENIHIFSHFLNKNNFILSELPDFKKSKDMIQTTNNKIVIGIIGQISEFKGVEVLKKLITLLNGSNEFEIVLFGYCSPISVDNINSNPYQNIFHLNNLLIKFKPNVLLDLSIWPETYCYTLSLAILTQLPIISLNKNFPSVIKNRLSNYDKSYHFSLFNNLIPLIRSIKQDYFYTIEPVLYYNDFWDNYFITEKNKLMIDDHARNKYDIKVFPIYFPQFHTITENDTSFYKNFTDTRNLKLLMDDTTIYFSNEQPSYSELSIKDIYEYDLTCNSLLQRQIDIITDYNLQGFAMYYYWFSENSITQKNMIMESVWNKFFDNSIDMKSKKIFFIWANEDWSGNPAFGNCGHKIENKYTEETINANVSNLLSYFTNENYYKIDNKPVFMIYHPWFMTEEELQKFYGILELTCKNNGFDGIHFTVNSMKTSYEPYTNFIINFNYKKSASCYHDKNIKQNFLDYDHYINNYKNDSPIQTIVLDFDNRARLIKPNKLESSTICINNTELNKKKFINTIIEKYNKETNNEVEKILLLNSWNEWGEKMTFEPSYEYDYYNLNLLISQLRNK